jgi:membrane-bound lytic murein transglycosylase D
MGGTGNKLGLDLTPWYDGRLDVVQSTDAALQYLSALQQRFDGDWLLAVAAYNAGWGTIEKAVTKQHRNGRKADIWSLDIKTDTLDFAARLLALAVVMDDPEAYGIDLPAVPDEPYFTKVELPHAVDLRKLADALGLPEQEFKLLNAAWRRGHTGTTLRPGVLVPVHRADAALELAANLPASPLPTLAPERSAPGRVAGKTHTVRAGDSLWTIARHYHLDAGKLAAANGLKKNTVLKLGQQIALGIPDASAKAGKTARTQGRTGNPAVAARRYKVREGDSLWTISRQFKVTVDQLAAWNGLKPKQDLQPGQELVVARPS